MRDPEAARIVIVCESDADQRVASGLADRIVMEQLQPADGTALDALRRWSGLTDGVRCLPWSRVKIEAGRFNIRAHGHFEGEPGAPDASAARRALLLISRQVPDARAVVLVRDADHQPERRIGLEQARSWSRWRFSVVVGIADPKRECWLLAAYMPDHQDEAAKLRELRQELEFDPCAESHRLRDRHPDHPRNAKKVLDRLSGGDAARAESGIDSTPLDTLRQRGTKNGLCEYLDEVVHRLVPVLRGS